MRRTLLALAAGATLLAPTASAFAIDQLEFDGQPAYVVAPGERYETVLNSRVPLNRDGSRGALFMFTGTEGACLEVRMESNDFAPYVRITRGTPDGQEVAYQDSLGGRTARLRVRLPSTGTYFAKATSSGTGERLGRYALALDRC
jgi:hypothetical protein